MSQVTVLASHIIDHLPTSIPPFKESRTKTSGSDLQVKDRAWAQRLSLDPDLYSQNPSLALPSMHLAQDSPFSAKEGLCPMHSMQMEDFCPFPLRATRWMLSPSLLGGRASYLVRWSTDRSWRRRTPQRS